MTSMPHRIEIVAHKRHEGTLFLAKCLMCDAYTECKSGKTASRWGAAHTEESVAQK
jgi:hypothetical protein